MYLCMIYNEITMLHNDVTMVYNDNTITTCTLWSKNIKGKILQNFILTETYLAKFNEGIGTLAHIK